MAVPKYQSFLLPVLQICSQGPFRFRDIVPLAADRLELTEEDRRQRLPSGTQTVLMNRVGWARTYLFKAGLLERPEHAVYTISAAGKKVLDQKPELIDNAFLLRFPSFCKFMESSGQRPKKKSQDALKLQHEEEASKVDSNLTPEDRIEAAFEEMQAVLRTELLSRVPEMSPGDFEELVVGLMIAMGYGGSDPRSGWRCGGVGDEGIDGIIDEDKLGLDRVYLQAKRYQEGNTVGRPSIQQFIGAMSGKANKGVFVTTSSFSRQAWDCASQAQQRLILVDGERLAKLMIEHDVGVRLERAVKLKKIDEDFF